MFPFQAKKNKLEILHMRKKVFVASLPLLAFMLTLCSTTEPTPMIVKVPEPEIPKIITYSFAEAITWADEFDSDGRPDDSIWNYDLGAGGWGNKESQHYTNDSSTSRVEEGNLVIETRKSDELPKYTSARMVTKNKKDFLYGRIEVKAKVPVGRGTWAAIWTLGSNDIYGSEAYWPDNGEMDLMEHVGFDQDVIHSNIHTRAFHHSIGTNKGQKKFIKDASVDFHIYRLDWYPNAVEFYIDDELLFEFKKIFGYTWREWPFDQPQHLLLNIAIGGDWGGQKGIDDSVFPQKMLVDYVRYYDLVITEE
ncbi:MAG: beta-glucanase (GH16 family) [Psychromonas sp.]